MGVHTISAQTVLQTLRDCARAHSGGPGLIDARSEAEFALDHLPGAVNWPSLRDAERVRVGTLYKQVSVLEANKVGAALVAANIARHIEAHVMACAKDWQPVVYCWRGGKRSGSLALVLGQIGFRVRVIEGGYKAFRAALVADLPQRVAPLSFRVVCGPTGSGKTRLLQALAAQGAQVLDLEALARHRSSVLGRIPGVEQPSQKHFDALVWHALSSFDPQRVVYVEAESRKVGNLAVPESLMHAMRASPCLDVSMPEAQRVALLLADYPFFVNDPTLFCERLDALTEIRGRAVVQAWQEQVMAGDTASVVQGLLHLHYDPTYAKSIGRNFTQHATAIRYTLADGQAATVQALATQILRDAC